MSNGKLYTKSFEEWKNQKPSRQALTHKEAKKRYEDYLLSAAVGGPNYVNRKANYRNGNNVKSNQRDGGSSHPYRKTLGSLSQCTRDYALALMDPWSLEKPGCIPDLIVLPSYKFGTRAKGTFTVGSAGVGYVAVNYASVANGVVSGTNVFYAGVVTDQTFTGNGFVPGIGVGRNPFANDSTIDYQKLRGVNPAETRPFDFRLVGCGCKTRAIGPEFVRGGRMVGYREPEGKNITGAQTANQLLLNREAVTVPVDRIEHFVTYRPSNPDQLGYSNRSTLGDVQLLMLVEGAQPGFTFEYDIIWWFEMVGSSLPSYSASHSDPLGMAAVTQALPATQPTQSPGTQFKNFVNDVIEVASMAMSFVGPLL